ncbi:MAG: hypothetical protein V3R17_06685 [Hyphomicrobium sp.]
MAQNKFKAYIQEHQWSDKLRDFADHAVGDLSLPDAESWEQLEGHLDELNASPETLSAAKHVWQGYEADTSKKTG